ncbi:MAG: PKD domain-containing protein [Candidatus Latescibacter sp.]|nr:PKD domain-containing protein [Candidatus Latescibacter sp.]
MQSRIFLFFLALSLVCFSAGFSLSRPDKEFKIFQFPRDQIPRIDGNTDDWNIVPDDYAYGNEEINDTEDGHGANIDPKNLNVKVKVGWVKGENRLYFLYEADDDYWDFGRFNPRGYLNDIFEIAVDGDLSGGPFITNPQIKDPIENHLAFSGVQAQNYHIFTPPVNNCWCLVWGCQPWIAEFPWANYAFKYNFKPGESGHLVLESYITPFDYAPYDGPGHAVVSQLRENSRIGLSWSILDFDGGKRNGHYNLAHNVKMVSDASYLCSFRLMPLEERLQKPIEARWSFRVVDMDRRMIEFKDESHGKITGWKWEFGDGETSNEQNPVHAYKKPGVYYVVVLEVEGPAGKSRTAKYWDVMVK